jgi:hypothetical protein
MVAQVCSQGEAEAAAVHYVITASGVTVFNRELKEAAEGQPSGNLKLSADAPPSPHPPPGGGSALSAPRPRGLFGSLGPKALPLPGSPKLALLATSQVLAPLGHALVKPIARSPAGCLHRPSPRHFLPPPVLIEIKPLAQGAGSAMVPASGKDKGKPKFKETESLSLGMFVSHRNSWRILTQRFS